MSVEKPEELPTEPLAALTKGLFEGFTERDYTEPLAFSNFSGAKAVNEVSNAAYISSQFFGTPEYEEPLAEGDWNESPVVMSVLSDRRFLPSLEYDEELEHHKAYEIGKALAEFDSRELAEMATRLQNNPGRAEIVDEPEDIERAYDEILATV